ncbi:phosphoglycolate phosphatase [Brevirhabdus pacifica]|uniref:Phosphoglycolate phosphatase n=1 Tax=Brevirhabdus pacifica TaxID=1267768 RepID=A0A1U7DGN1_9RHOB|nr:phosphoglycolate phosphatase [Brevirhabdus pacifica]APX89095.1 phosphoglycolate phosphatase [Brevirhabdus pacifica]OWU76844.1 phosphoglycolate phosphatase [Loktanella sp. 22II-4b]PJJ86323.1 phosphoglycolate phosphatase [Brevirhabdus pacifica]
MKAIIFDLDGTLIDSAPDIHAASAVVLKAEGLPPLPFEQVRGFIGNGVGVLISRVIAASGVEETPELHARMSRRFYDIYESAVNLTELYPGVPALLERLQKRGFRLGVCTNKPIEATRAVLGHFDLLGRFDMLVGGECLPVKKPDPAPLQHTVRSLGATNILYVGDSEVDAETARAAGLDFALFTPGYRKAPVESLPHVLAFDHYDQLGRYIDKRFGVVEPT